MCVLFFRQKSLSTGLHGWIQQIFLIASQRRGTIGRGYNRAWSEEVQKEGSEVKYLCTGTAPPYRKWRAS